MRDKLEQLMSPWTAKQGCGPQECLRDILTDLRHLAKDEHLDFDQAVEGSLEVYEEEWMLLTQEQAEERLKEADKWPGQKPVRMDLVKDLLKKTEQQ